MNAMTNPYPAALFSAVSEVGYRTERFTGEVLRSGNNRRSRRAGRRTWGRFTRSERETQQESDPAT